MNDNPHQPSREMSVQRLAQTYDALRRQEDRCNRWRPWVCLVGLLVGWASVIIWIFTRHRWGLPVSYVAAGVLAIDGLRALQLARRLSRIREKVIQRAATISSQKLQNAYKMYGYGDWVAGCLVAIECDEAHIPGDCLLCGAD